MLVGLLFLFSKHEPAVNVEHRNIYLIIAGNGTVDVGTYSSNITRIGRLQCGECDEKYLDYESLCAHLMHAHSVTANVLTISLNSWTEFDLWKQQVRRRCFPNGVPKSR
jgi:hypothetical protein